MTLPRAEVERGQADWSPTVGAVVLAAGSGSRFEGGFKLLEEIDGEPIVRHAVRSLVASDVSPVVTVVGYRGDAVREVLDDLATEIVVNADYERGQSESLGLGVEWAREREWDGIVYGLGDMPFVDPATITLLYRAYAQGRGSIVAPAYEGQRGNPALFGREHYDELAAVTGDRGGRPVLRSSDDVAVVETGDPGTVRDIDTRADLSARE